MGELFWMPYIDAVQPSENEAVFSWCNEHRFPEWFMNDCLQLKDAR